MFYVYAIRSQTRNYIYVGLTDNLNRRFLQHNKKLNPVTRAYAPFDLIWTGQYATRAEARKKEKYLKSGVGKQFLRGLKK